MHIDTAITTEDWVDTALRNKGSPTSSRPLRCLLRGLALLVATLLLGALLGWITGGGEAPSLRQMLLVDAPADVRWLFLVSIAPLVAMLIGRCAFYDRLQRRRYRRWAIREHGLAPSVTHYGVDEAGVIVSDDKGRTRMSWPAVTGLEETERLFFLLGANGGVLPIPKRDLPGADREQLRETVLAHLSDLARQRDPDAPALPPEAVDDADVLVRLRQTAEDRAAAIMLVWNTPRRRRRRAWAASAVALGLALVIFGLDTFGWWLRPHAHRSGEPFSAFLQVEAATFWGPTLYAAALGFGLWLLWPWLLRRQAMAHARKGADLPVNLAFGPAGVAAAVPGIDFRYAWSGVRAVLEGPGHIGLLLPLSVVLPIPKGALDVGQLDALRRLLAERVR